jgi:hypothetical protein
MDSCSPARHDVKLPESECSFEEKYASLPITGSPLADQSADEPPDGGVLAWLQVTGSFFVLMNTWYVYRR